MEQIAGHCGKCGAPYSYMNNVWHSVVPQTPIPSSACWNIPMTKTTTTTSFIYNPPEQFEEL